MPKIRQKLAELEPLEGGGAGGMGGGGGGGRRLTMDERVAENAKNAGDMKKNMAGLAGYMAGPVVGGVGAIGGSKLIQNAREKREAEAAAEMQRETRRVEKTSTDRAREAAAEMKLQERTNKAYEDASKNMKKGGAVSASKRADGIAQRGKTRGKMR